MFFRSFADIAALAAHYQSYLKLKAESDFNEMSYVDNRKKDKAFGKVVKSVLKQKSR